MAVKVGSFTLSGTPGDHTVDNLGFLPTNLILWVGNSSSSVSSSFAQGNGRCTTLNQNYDCYFSDSTGSSQKYGGDKCIRVEKRSGGSIVDSVVGTFVDFHTTTPTNHGFTLNFTAADSRQIRYMASDA